MTEERRAGAAGDEVAADVAGLTTAAAPDDAAAADAVATGAAAAAVDAAAATVAGAALEAGRVGRPHGLDGSFYVTGARPRLLVAGAKVTLAGGAHEIVRRAGVDQRPIVRLGGVEDRNAVEALRGAPLTVPIAEAPDLEQGEWWSHELEGCTVYDGARALGTVLALLELPSCEVLQVRRAEGGELLVPMVKDAVRVVDVAARRIEIDLDFLGGA
jgi:16S rRNA processing protein RimM